MPAIAFKTVGCRLNQAETMTISAAFEAAGYDVVASPSDADALVIHTCTITANAERTCLRAARAAKRDNPACIVVMAGCAVEASRDKLAASDAVDLVAGQREKYNLIETLSDALNAAPRSSPRMIPDSPRRGRTRALIKVQDGCDFGCAYCIVPHTRGAPRSRPLAAVVEDVAARAEAGYREVVLTGANLGLYKADGQDLVALLAAIEEQTTIERIRLSSIESTTVEKRMIPYMAASSRLCRFLHIPMQSGDDHVLARMGRKYDAAAYRATIQYAAATVPDVGIGTDVIVGFPGEDRRAFVHTRDMVADLPFGNLHVFPYSPRPHTPAPHLSDQVPAAVKKQRVAALRQLGHAKRRDFAGRFIGRPVDVLIEHVDPERGATGWTQAYIEVRIAPGRAERARVNDLLTVCPTGLDAMTLIVQPSSKVQKLNVPVHTQDRTANGPACAEASAGRRQ